jgi:guanylate kinase
MIVVLMGVSGVGKTTIGKLLVARTGWKSKTRTTITPRKTGGKWPPESH